MNTTIDNETLIIDALNWRDRDKLIQYAGISEEKAAEVIDRFSIEFDEAKTIEEEDSAIERALQAVKDQQAVERKNRSNTMKKIYVKWQQQPKSQESYAEFTSMRKLLNDISDTFAKVPVYQMYIGIVGEEHKERSVL